jgi:hypothetical protein
MPATVLKTRKATRGLSPSYVRTLNSFPAMAARNAAWRNKNPTASKIYNNWRKRTTLKLKGNKPRVPILPNI